MRHLFGRKKKTDASKQKYTDKIVEVKSSEHSLTIGRIKHTIQNLKKRLTLLDTKTKQELKQAAVYKSQNKTKEALVSLKRKNVYEKESTKLQNTIFTLEQQILSLESSVITSEMIETQHMVKSSLEKLTLNTTVEDVTELQDQIQENIEQNEEVNRILGENPSSVDFDDIELNGELDALLGEDKIEEEQISVDIVEEEATLNLPAVPNTKVEIKNTDEEAELQKLMKEMVPQK